MGSPQAPLVPQVVPVLDLLKGPVRPAGCTLQRTVARRQRAVGARANVQPRFSTSECRHRETATVGQNHCFGFMWNRFSFPAGPRRAPLVPQLGPAPELLGSCVSSWLYAAAHSGPGHWDRGEKGVLKMCLLHFPPCSAATAKLRSRARTIPLVSSETGFFPERDHPWFPNVCLPEGFGEAGCGPSCALTGKPGPGPLGASLAHA